VSTQAVDRRQKSLAGRKGARNRWGIEIPEGIDGDIYLAKLERDLARLVAEAPPLTPEQREKLRVLWRGATQ
jgi:hypothetical protein